MKKQKTQILILLVLCIVCVGGYFIIRNHTFETEEETVSVDVTNFNKDDVTELILSGDHEVHLVKTDDIWTESSLPDETIKESTVNTLLNEIANITTTETVVEAPEDLSQYGLEEPFRTITAVLSDGTQVVIYAGNKSDLLSEYYIKVEGDDNVYLVSSNIVTDFDKDPEDFVDETETETETADSADETASTDAIEETAAAKTLESADGETESADAEGENAGRLAETETAESSRADGSQKVSISEKFNTRKVSEKRPEGGSFTPSSGHFLCHQADDLIHFQLFLRCGIFADRREDGRNFCVGKTDGCFVAFLCQRHQKRQQFFL